MNKKRMEITTVSELIAALSDYDGDLKVRSEYPNGNGCSTCGYGGVSEGVVVINDLESHLVITGEYD